MLVYEILEKSDGKAKIYEDFFGVVVAVRDGKNITPNIIENSNVLRVSFDDEGLTIESDFNIYDLIVENYDTIFYTYLNKRYKEYKKDVNTNNVKDMILNDYIFLKEILKKDLYFLDKIIELEKTFNDEKSSDLEILHAYIYDFSKTEFDTIFNNTTKKYLVIDHDNDYLYEIDDFFYRFILKDNEFIKWLSEA